MEKRSSARILVVVASLLLFLHGSCAIEIVGNVTEKYIVIENGTVDDVVLDCPYELDEDDKPGLVIKWFYEGDSYPFFQWIPEGEPNTPQLLEFEDRLDSDHLINEDPHHQHRALKLVSPTTEVHGLYTCEVSSHFAERKLDVNLIVYSLPSALTIMVNETEDDNITVTCETEPAFPEPEVELTMLVAGERTDLDVDQETSWSDGLYNTTLTAVVDGDSVSASPVVQFLCTLKIPHTNISVTEGLKYRSDGLPIYDESREETVIEEAFESEDSLDLEVNIGASTHRDNKVVRENAAGHLSTSWISWIAVTIGYLLVIFH